MRGACILVPKKNFAPVTNASPSDPFQPEISPRALVPLDVRAPRCFLFEQCAIESSAGDSADQRRNPEQPQLLERQPAHEQRRAGAPRRIDRGVCDGNANEVDQVSASPIAMAQARRRSTVGRAQDHEYKTRSQNDLAKPTRKHVE